MSMAVGSKLELEPGSWMEALYDVYIGMVVGTRHICYISLKWWYTAVAVPALNLLGFQINKHKKVESKDGKKTLKVVGVGYGRTGTYSVKLALEELGLPTLHTQHLYEFDHIIAMWTERVFNPAIAAKQSLMGEPDFDLIVDTGFQASMDLPMALYYEKIMEQYPDCKFILTTRDSSEVWFRSWDTLTKSITQPTRVGGSFFTNVKQYSNYLRWLFSVVNLDDSYLTVPEPLPDQNKRASIHTYEEHNRRVRATIPKDRLLEYSVKDGWDPLCKFLEVDNCPTTPFPKTNSARSVQVQAISSFMIPLIITLFIVFYAFAKTFQNATGMTVMQWSSVKSRELQNRLRCFFLGQEPVKVFHPKRKMA